MTEITFFVFFYFQHRSDKRTVQRELLSVVCLPPSDAKTFSLFSTREFFYDSHEVEKRFYFILQHKIWYHFSRYCFLCLFFSFPSLRLHNCTTLRSEETRQTKKFYFAFLMHAKSNGSRHFCAINPTSNQHEIYAKRDLLPTPPQSLNDIPSIYSTSKRIPNVILTCVCVKY